MMSRHVPCPPESAQRIACDGLRAQSADPATVGIGTDGAVAVITKKTITG